MKNSKKLKVKGILFDLDGTIVDSREAYLEALKTALAVYGQEYFSKKMIMEIPRRLEQNMPLNDILREVDVQGFLEAYLKAYYEATMEKTKPLPGISNT
ncbi:MAG: HAD hydrolase-like protein, partial [Desulfonauticus sp.]|nr:HAD hydrolase-like protein [Desulfonauticus sp.]